MARLIDLSHEIEHGMVTYRGLPSPTVSDWLSREDSSARYAPGTTFQIGKIELLANTGTYIDAPFHRYPAGRDISGYDLEAVADLPGIVIRTTSSTRPIDRARFEGRELKGKAVLVHTGWDAHWRTDTYSAGQYPFVTRDAAEYLVQSGAALVGIDSLNIDDDKDGSRPAHTILLGAGVAIVEHMTNLAALPDAGFRFYAVPPRVKGMGSFPVRAFARLD
ncbi:MAG TPA: cyclase family protein, partial [Gemmatimonadaceae bacterium]|nr:cyclase family protein [Gemmatimonadaceae bacterium]